MPASYPAQHGGEDLGVRRSVAPDIGLVVERIGERDDGTEQARQALPLDVGGLREVEPERQGQIGHQRRLAAGAGERAEARPEARAAEVQDLQRLEKFGRRRHLGHAKAAR